MKSLNWEKLFEGTWRENLRLKKLWDGMDVYAAMLAELNW
jgi:hypothetical protein